MEIKEPKNILLIGDIMLDEWLYGDVERLSPEAPIPILDAKKSVKSLGGAGNVLVNLKEFPANITFFSGLNVLTEIGMEIKRMIGSEIISHFFEIPFPFKKQRICSNQQQIVRIDTGKGRKIDDIWLNNRLDNLDVDIVMVADYGKGAITRNCLIRLSDFCSEKHIRLIVDPYKRSYYKDVSHYYFDLIKLNRDEAEYFTGIKIESEDDVKRTMSLLKEAINSESFLLTLGQDGMVYSTCNNDYQDEPLRIIDNPVHIYDVCGAGDVVFAVLGYLMAENRFDMKTIIEYAAKAGKLAVSKRGTSIITKDELFKEN